MSEPAINQKTIQYKTYLKQSLREGLETALNSHIDERLKANVVLSFPRKEQHYSAIIIRFYEKTIKNAGVGHFEQFDPGDGEQHLFKHYLYDGDVEFAIHTLTTVERDTLSDGLVEVITMGELQDYTQHFLSRIYPLSDAYPDAIKNFIAVDTDTLRGFGENEAQVGWLEDDQLVYQTSYRVSVFGEFYSLTGPERFPIEHTPIYPWIKDREDMPQGNPNDPAPWI